MADISLVFVFILMALTAGSVRVNISLTVVRRSFRVIKIKF
jgi:hypothetical protein